MTTRTQNATIGCAAILALMTQAAPGALFTFRIDNLDGDGQSWQNLWDSPENWTLNSGVDDGANGIPDGADTFVIDRTSNVSNGTRLVTEGGPLLEVAGITGTGTGNQDIVLKHRDFTLGDLEVLASSTPFHIRSERDRNYSITGVISGVGNLLLSRSGGFSDGVDPNELITITGTSPNTITGTIRLYNDNGSGQPSYWVADKVGAFGQASTLTLEGRAGLSGVASLQITANAIGGEGAIDDDATTVYIGAEGVLDIVAGVTEKIGIGNLFIDLAGTGTYTEIAPGSYNNSEDWITGDGTILVGEAALSPEITSINSIGGGNWELTLTGEADTGYEFRSSPVLYFDPGTLVENLTPGVPSVGTIGGANDSVLTTDENGDGTVRMMLAGPTNFVRAQIPPPPPPLFSEGFELTDGGFTTLNKGTGTDWEWGAPTSPDQGGGGVTSGNDGSAKCWATNLSGGYAAGTDTCLRSDVIDLTGVAAANLSFALALDADVGHTYEVNVIDATNDDPATNVIANIIPATEDTDALSAWETVGPTTIPAAALGQAVRLEWRFTGAGSGVFNGAYVDDVMITVP
jgi:hypothetical protein